MENTTTIKISKGNYRIERIDGFSIEVIRESKRVWRTSFDNSTRRTLGEFENEMEAGLINPVEKEDKKKTKRAKKVSNFYKGHRSERTAELHRIYDEMERKDALKHAVEEMGYTIGGARAWFSDWDREARNDKIANS